MVREKSLRINRPAHTLACRCLIAAVAVALGCASADLRGTYQSVSESEWNLTVELKDNNAALIIIENWLPGEYESRQIDTTVGQWQMRDDAVLLSYDNVVDTLTFDQNLSRQELGEEGGSPGLEQRTKFDPEKSLIRRIKLWRI